MLRSWWGGICLWRTPTRHLRNRERDSIDTAKRLDLVGLAARAAADKKALDVVVLDVGDLLSITDYFVICSGASDRQIRTIVDEVADRLKQVEVRPVRREGEREGGWILLDYGDFVVHVFRPEERAFYDLERLWKDAPRVNVLEAEEATG
jgi:ribosome-associated protein